MALEAASFVSGLVATNPPSGDLTSQGDDHIRLMKSVLLATFPNASKAFYFPDHATKTGNYTVLVADQNKLFSGDATGGQIDFTLPVVGINAGFSVIINKSDVSVNVVRLVPASGTVSGAASLSLTSQFAGAIAFWTGATWIALRFVTNTIDGLITFSDDVTFNDVVTFNQGIEFNGPLQVDGVTTTNNLLQIADQLALSPQVLVDGATVAWNMGLSPYAKWTAAGNRTLSAPTNATEGTLVLLKYTQDAAGNRIPTFDAAYKGVGGGPVPRPGLLANEETLYLGLVRGAADVIMVRLWTSLHRQPQIYNDVDMGDWLSQTTYTHTHNLGYMPKVEWFLKITTAQFGYSVGDYVTVDVGQGAGQNTAPTLKINSTDVKLKVDASNGAIQRFSTNGQINIDALSTVPKVIFRVWE